MDGRSRACSFRITGLALSLVALLGCEANDQEQAVLKVVGDGIALLENGNVGKAMNLATRDFLAQPGRLNRSAITGRLFNFYRVNGDIAILHPSPDVEVHDSGETALVSMPFVVAKEGVTVEALDDLSDDPEAWIAAAKGYTEVHQVEISMVKKDDRWLVQTIRF